MADEEQPKLDSIEDAAQSPPQDQDIDVEVSIDDETPTVDDPSPSSALRPIKAIYDDFSLTSGAASGVRFRNHNQTREFKIYDQPNAQLILEEVEDRDTEEDGEERNGGRGIRIKQAYDTSYGLQFLR